MAAKKPGRYLAPVALIAPAVAVGLIVSAHVGSHHPAGNPPVHTAATTATHRTRASKPRYYVIKPGDSLSTISAKTGVSIAKLEALNPSVDPAALQSGERLRLPP